MTLVCGQSQFSAYGILVGLGYVLVMLRSEERAILRGFKRGTFLDVSAIGILGAMCGSRIYSQLVSKDVMFDRSSSGAILFGLGCLLLALRVKKVPLLIGLDILAIDVPLGQALGRLGCALAGCCHGRPCEPGSVIGLVYPKIYGEDGSIMGSHAYLKHLESGLITTDAAYSLPVYPTQLISTLSLACISFILLVLYQRQKNCPGTIFFSYLLLYGVFRFMIEFWRTHDVVLGFLTAAQMFSIGSCFVGAVGLFYIIGARSTGVKV